MKKEDLRPVQATIMGKKKNGRFHGWGDVRVEDEQGNSHYVKVAFVEDAETGVVYELDSDNFRFTDI